MGKSWGRNYSFVFRGAAEETENFGEQLDQLLARYEEENWIN